SLKKIARGLPGPMRGAWKLVFENTSIWDDTGTSSAVSTDCRYPLGPFEVSVTSPLASFAFRRATGSETAAGEAARAARLRIKAGCGRACPEITMKLAAQRRVDAIRTRRMDDRRAAKTAPEAGPLVRRTSDVGDPMMRDRPQSLRKIPRTWLRPDTTFD